MGIASFNFKSNKLFPWQFQFLGAIFLCVSLLIIFQSPYFTPLFLLLGVTILTGYRGVDFDRDKNLYREYNSFFFLKFGSWSKFDSAEKIFVNSANVSQMIYTRVTTGTTTHNVEYNAYLKFGNGTKIYLLTAKKKEIAIGKLAEISEFFQLEVVDNT